VNYAKLIFSCNKMPRFTNDESVALHRRFIFVKFPNSFPVGDPRRDDKILDKMTTPEELSGVLNWAIIGLKRLQENGAFTYTTDTEAIRETYNRMSDSVKAFCNEELEYNLESEASKDDLFNFYQMFCTKNQLLQNNKDWFFRKLKSYMPNTKEVEIKIEGTNMYLHHLVGIAFKKSEEEIDAMIGETACSEDNAEETGLGENPQSD